ncbi:MAG: SHOCT domain-containing protein [Candidatus Dormibacteria bacterium]
MSDETVDRASEAPEASVSEKYRVLYLGGLPQYPKKQNGFVRLIVRHDRFSFEPAFASRWLRGPFDIPYKDVVSVALAPMDLGAARSILGGLNSRQLNQTTNIHIAYNSDGHELVLRLAMASGGVTLMAEANKAREFMDRLRTRYILEKFKGGQATAVPSSGSDPLAQIAKLSELTEQGVLTREEFEAKKTELLGRL